MMRVLFIARYRDVTMDRKLHLLAEAGIRVRHVRPAQWRDPLLHVNQPNTSHGNLEQIGIPMWGRADDPHRTLYRTLTFGLRAFQPHLIHAEEEPDSLSALQIVLARRAFAPRAALLLHTWQNLDRPRRPEVRWVIQQSFRAANGVLCANTEALTLVARYGYRGYTEVLPAIGVDTDTFQPCAARVAGARFVAGYFGRLVPEKGVDVLLRAVAQCAPTIAVSILGGGPHRAALETQARALGLAERAQFLPPVRPHEIAQHLCRLDALVLPSQTTAIWKEQFGRVLAEAMACGLPVIGSDSGAIPEVIGEAGLIFPEGDASALARHLRTLAQSPGLCRSLAERGHARVHTHYSQSVIARRTLAVYRRLCPAASETSQEQP